MPKGRIRLFDPKVILYVVVFATTGTIPKGNRAAVHSHSMHSEARWNARSSSVIERIEGWSAISRAKLVPMLVAPFVSRFRGSIQSRCVQRRSLERLFSDALRALAALLHAGARPVGLSNV